MASSADPQPAVVHDFDYVEEQGPGIHELKSPPAVPETALEREDPASLYPGWEQATVEQFLTGTGHGLHLLLGAGEKDWLMTQTDLDRIAPPLTRIMNRYEPALAASVYADPLLVGWGLGLYGWRSVLQRQAALKARAEARGDGYVHESAVLDVEPQVNGRPPVEPGGDGYVPYAQRRSQ
jgi:hypothetical protein